VLACKGVQSGNYRLSRGRDEHRTSLGLRAPD
jgi:hypothetical protein